MPKFRIAIRPPHEREDLIKKGCASPLEKQRFFFFRSKERQLEVIQLPIDLPLYRVNSYRTLDKQFTLVAQGKHPKDFFALARQEDIGVQQVQHQILLDFAKEGVGEDVLPIWDELEKREQQTDNILITSHGVVVNGNRRLSAMRELNATGHAKFAKFSHVNCAVLPADASEEDLVEVEIQLQMAPETKLPYSWITTARAMRDLRQKGKTNAEIERVMRVDDSVIDREIAKLEQVDLYLTEWLGTPHDYSVLKETQQAFNQIATRNPAGKKSLEIRDATRSFDFFLVENRESLEDRAYDYINTIEGNAEKFLADFASEMKISIGEATPEGGESLDFELRGASPSPNYKPLAQFLKNARGNPKAKTSVIETITNICEAISEQKKNKGGAALRFARQALQKMDAIDLSTAAKETLGDIAQVAQAIETKASELHKNVNKLAKKK